MPRAPIPSPLFDTLAQFQTTVPNLPGHLPFEKSDYQLVSNFLKQYDGNESTFNSYRREVERLLHWSWLLQNKSILVLQRPDIEAYIKFCLKPRKSWIGLKKVRRFKTQNNERLPNPQWRPFVATLSKTEITKGVGVTKDNYALSQKTIKEIFVALSSFYHFLQLENITETNPVSTIRQKSKFIRKSQTHAKIPRFNERQWKAIVKTVESMAKHEPDIHERTLFIISTLYLMYLRISELTACERWTPLMKHFYKDSHNNWWFITVGKGNKERHITVSDGMCDALKRWRKHLGLSPSLPTLQDNHPLIPKLKGQGGITSTRWINQLIQTCFDKAAERLRAKNQIEEAEHLASATVHWLRHTGISDDINKRGRPIAHVRDDAGHSSIATTDLYNDITLKERHASARHKRIESE